MLQKYNKYKILNVFFNDPLPKGGGLQLREISRVAALAPTSVKIYLKELEAEGFITKSKHRIYNYPVYFANRDAQKFRFYKKVSMLAAIYESGLLDYLENKCMPSIVVLFGSAARGEDTKDSDIDLFIESGEKNLQLELFEKKIGRKINPLFSPNFNRLSKTLKNNIINGIVLKGYLKVF